MTPAEQFVVWRQEIAAELESTQEQLQAERAKLTAAEAAYETARAAWAALHKFAEGAVSSPAGSMASPLHSRLQDARAALTATEGPRGASRAAIESLAGRVSDLQLAVAQIDAAITAHKVTALPVAQAAPTRRKPQLIDFDNIQLPREAAR